MPRTLAITKSPAPCIVDCELTYLAREPIQFERALEQHHAYCAALRACGVDVITLPGDPDLPDSVFVEDTAVVVDELAVLGALGTPARRPEAARIAQYLARLRPVAQLTEPATLEGGDVLQIGRTIYVGLSPRTNRAGAAALQQILAPYGYTVVEVPVQGCLHLKTGCTALDDQTLLVNPDWVDLAPFETFRIIPTAPGEPWAANVLRLETVLLMNADSPKTIDRVRQLGHNVHAVDISELAKAEAGLTCLSLLINTENG